MRFGDDYVDDILYGEGVYGAGDPMFLVKSEPKPEDLALWRRVGLALRLDWRELPRVLALRPVCLELQLVALERGEVEPMQPAVRIQGPTGQRKQRIASLKMFACVYQGGWGFAEGTLS